MKTNKEVTYEEKLAKIDELIEQAKRVRDMLKPEPPKTQVPSDKDRAWYDKQVEDDHKTEFDEYWSERTRNGENDC